MTRPEVTGKRTGRRLLTFADLKARGLPWSRVHVGRLEAAGKFPQHIDVGDNSVAWFEDEYDDFLETKAAARAQRKPRPSPERHPLQQKQART